MNSFLIVNTRDGESPNVLGAIYNTEGEFVPQMVAANDNQIPSNLPFNQWTLKQIEPGLFQLQIADHTGQIYCLCTSDAESNGACVLVKNNSASLNQYYSFWSSPFPTRLLLSYGNSITNQLSLDAGKYPNLMVYKFVSTVNQTWQFGLSLDSLSPNPPFN